MRTEVLLGRDEVLRALPRLLARAAAWRQEEALDEVPYFLARPTGYRQTACLVVICEGDEVQGAVLLARYDGLLRPFRFYLAADRRGRRVVFGPEAERLDLAARAGQAMVEAGARFVQMVFEREEEVSIERARGLAGLRLTGPAKGFAEWSLHAGRRRGELALSPDSGAVLAAFGKETRRNMRRYARFCREKLGAEFRATAEVSLETFLALNASSTHPTSVEVARWRYGSAGMFPGLFTAGLQAGDGSWLALLGGARRAGVTTILWQMNRAGLARYSVGTAMRAALLEYEGAAGRRALRIEGGTSHAMSAGFALRPVFDLVVRRPSVGLRLLSWGLSRWFPRKAPALALPKSWRVWRACLRSELRGKMR